MHMTKSSGHSSNQASERCSRFLLVVSSDSSELFYISMLLQRFEYNICTAKTGTEVFELSSCVLPAIIIADMTLVDMNGIELITMLKQVALTAELPIIVTTMEQTPEKEQQCLQAGALAFIENPVHAEKLYRLIQVAIETTPRKKIRITTHLPVSVNNMQFDSLEGEYASVLSEQGMYIRTLKPFPPKSSLTVRIMIAGRLVVADAVVLYSNAFEESPYKEPGMGLLFTRIAPQDQTLLQQFINEQINKGIRML